MLEVSKAIIYHRNDYLLQLRDHTPGIVYAGVWSFFLEALLKHAKPPGRHYNANWQKNSSGNRIRVPIFTTGSIRNIPAVSISLWFRSLANGLRWYSMRVRIWAGLTWMR